MVAWPLGEPVVAIADSTRRRRVVGELMAGAAITLGDVVEVEASPAARADEGLCAKRSLGRKGFQGARQFTRHPSSRANAAAFASRSLPAPDIFAPVSDKGADLTLLSATHVASGHPGHFHLGMRRGLSGRSGSDWLISHPSRLMARQAPDRQR